MKNVGWMILQYAMLSADVISLNSETGPGINSSRTIRSTTNKDLTEADCESNETSLLGIFNGFSLEDAELRPNDDEWETRAFECSLSNNVVEECEDFVKKRLKDTVLMVNGTLLQSENYTREYDIDLEVMKFSVTLDYETHHKADLACIYNISEQASITSNILTIKKVNERHDLNIIPATTTITVGESYTLSCVPESFRAMEEIFWRRGLEDGSLRLYECEEEELCTLSEIEDPPASVLTITTLKNDTAKEYKYECTTITHFGNQPSAYATVIIKLQDKSWITIVAVVGSVVGALVVAIVVTVVMKRRRLRGNLAVSIRMTQARAEMASLRQMSNEYTGDRRESDQVLLALESISDIMDRVSRKHSAWEKDKSSLMIKEQIGVGNFGYVFVGTMPNEFGIIDTVAIKTIKEQGLEVNALLEFEKEMDMMTTIRHDHIVNLLGICTVSLPFYIIMEYMENGQLNTFLTDYAPSREMPLGGLSVSQLAWICQQPCDALEYLASRSMVHRDVSARNCLVGKELQVKLADFGLSRDTSDNAKNYYKKEGGMVPVKWMAPEALTYGKYTSANDVWAFGVVAWEVFSFGAVPYQHLTNQQVIVNICKGERLDRPQLCPQELWSKILQCWEDSPEERIMLSALLAFFRDHAQQYRI